MTATPRLYEAGADYDSDIATRKAAAASDEYTLFRAGPERLGRGRPV
ncbi:MAG: hypothetical protein ABI083_13355 [Lapillicoccus sp.]